MSTETLTLSNKRIKLSLEPIKLSESLINSLDQNQQQPLEEVEDSIFNSPLKLFDCNLETGLESFTRETEKPLGERLKRVWIERVEYAGRTPIKEVEVSEERDEDKVSIGDNRPSSEEMRSLQENLMQQLELARTELTTALDLLTVLAPITNPPTVDPNTLPLPAETLTLVQIAPTLSSSASINNVTSMNEEGVEVNSLPLATSLASIRASASSFFNASEPLLQSTFSNPTSPSASSSTIKPDPWPPLLSLFSSNTSSRTLVPIGAQRGATLSSGSTVTTSSSSAGENKLAKSVGIFFGAEEAGERYRMSSVVSIGELLRFLEEKKTIATESKGKGKEISTGGEGRIMVITIRERDREESAVWEEDEEFNSIANGSLEERMEHDLRRRSRSIFAEEVFALLSNEARLDTSLKAKLVVGNKSVGDSVITEGYEWSLKVTMVHKPLKTTSSSTSSVLARTLLSLLRLLFLQEYNQRRQTTLHPPSIISNSTNSTPWTRPILQTLSSFLSHRLRLKTIINLLELIRKEVKEEETELEVYGSSNVVRRFITNEGEDIAASGGGGEQGDLAETVSRVLGNEKEIGGRMVLRIGDSKTFHISHSLLLPSNPTLTSALAAASIVPHQALVLQSPSGPPVPVPSFAHLELFLREQLGL